MENPPPPKRIRRYPPLNTTTSFDEIRQYLCNNMDDKATFGKQIMAHEPTWTRLKNMVSDIVVLDVLDMLSGELELCEILAYDAGLIEAFLKEVERQGTSLRSVFPVPLITFLNHMLCYNPESWWTIVPRLGFANMSVSTRDILLERGKQLPERVWATRELIMWLANNLETSRVAYEVLIELTYNWCHANSLETKSVLWTDAKLHETLVRFCKQDLERGANILANMCKVDRLFLENRYVTTELVWGTIVEAFETRGENYDIPTSCITLLWICVASVLLSASELKEKWAEKLSPLLPRIKATCITGGLDVMRISIQLELLTSILDLEHSLVTEDLWVSVKENIVLAEKSPQDVMQEGIKFLHQMLVIAWTPDLSQLGITDFICLLRPQKGILETLTIDVLNMLQGFDWRLHKEVQATMWKANGFEDILLDGIGLEGDVRFTFMLTLSWFLESDSLLKHLTIINGENEKESLPYQLWQDSRFWKEIFKTGDQDLIIRGNIATMTCNDQTRLTMWTSPLVQDFILHNAPTSLTLLYKLVQTSSQFVSISNGVRSHKEIWTMVVNGMRIQDKTNAWGYLAIILALAESESILMGLWMDIPTWVSICSQLERQLLSKPIEITCFLSYLGRYLPQALKRMCQSVSLCEKLVSVIHSGVTNQTSMLPNTYDKVAHAMTTIQYISQYQEHQKHLWNIPHLDTSLVYFMKNTQVSSITAATLAILSNFALHPDIQDEVHDLVYEILLTKVLPNATDDAFIHYHAIRLQFLLELDPDELAGSSLLYPAECVLHYRKRRVRRMSRRRRPRNPMEIDTPSNSPNTETCPICLTNTPRVRLSPCNHKCLCCSCATMLMTQGELQRRCPLCRTSIEMANLE